MLNLLKNNFSQIRNLRVGIVPRVIALTILMYLVGLPLYPELDYDLNPPQIEPSLLSADRVDASVSGQKPTSTAITEPSIDSRSKTASTSKYDNRIIIKKIGVDAPIIVSSNGPAALNKGAWLMPQGSTPDFGSNTVITAHRFKYLPPNNLTFYLIDKLKPGDIITVIWKGITYHYEVQGSRRVTPKEVSILNPSTEPMLTIFSCDPVFSTKYRLVVTSKLID